MNNKDNHISLQEALDLLDSTDDPSTLMENESLWTLISDVDSYATEILKDKSEKYLLGTISLIKAMIMTTLISSNNPKQLMMAMTMFDSHEMDLVVTMAMKFAVGISVLEELH